MKNIEFWRGEGLTILRSESAETKKMKKLPIGIHNFSGMGLPVIDHNDVDDKYMGFVEGKRRKKGTDTVFS